MSFPQPIRELMMSNPDEVLKQLGRSGYPFQLRVEQEIRATQDEHQWKIASTEHPWMNPESSAEGFVDIVLEHTRSITFRLVVECKRIKADDARQLRWIFLLPNNDNSQTSICSCLEVEARKLNPNWKDIRIWDDVLLTPQSVQSEFCVLPNDEQKRQSILETLAQDVIESCEGLAEEEANIAKSTSWKEHLRLFIFPAIVTNAELVVCSFEPEKVKLSDGTIDVSDVKLSSVPFIRFRKSLSTKFPKGEFDDLEKANKARERTVFIVNAEFLNHFLKNWKVQPISEFNQYAISKYIR